MRSPKTTIALMRSKPIRFSNDSFLLTRCLCPVVADVFVLREIVTARSRPRSCTLRVVRSIGSHLGFSPDRHAARQERKARQIASAAS